MIKINIDQNRLDAIAEEHWINLNTLPYDILNKIEASLSDINRDEKEKELLSFLKDNIKKIITGKPQELINIIIDFYTIIDKNKFCIAYVKDQLDNQKFKNEIDCISNIFKKLNPNIKKLMEFLFDYKRFTQEYSKWGAYCLAEKLNVTVCPYCNRSWTFTINRAKGKTRPEFDHFYNKSKYPFLALSFYNLIPSCHICNSNLKGSKKFNPYDNIHPYKDGCENSYKFRIRPLKQNYLDSTDSFRIEIKEVTGKDQRVENNLKTFLIEELYNEHKDIALELVKKGIDYPKSWLDELADKQINGKRIFSSKVEIINNLVGNYICDEKDFGKRPLAKFTRDIIENETGLLNYIK